MESKKRQNRTSKSWLSVGAKEGKAEYHKVRAYNYWLEFLKPHDEKWVMANRQTEDFGTHLCDFRDFLAQQPKVRGEGLLSDNSTKTLANTIRGYLRHINASVQLTRTQKEHLTEVESMVNFDFPFNIRVKEKLLSVANPIEEYIVSVGVSFGLRIGDFKGLTRGKLEPFVNEDAPISIGKLPTEKKGIIAYPYISGDAKQAIIRLLKELDSMKRTDSSEKMIRKDDSQINKILQGLFDKAGIKIGDYKVRFHILRKFLSDNLSSVCSSDKWKLIVGKKAKSPYIAKDCFEAYKRVLPLIDCNGDRLRGSGSEQVKALRITVTQQEQEIIGLKTRITSLQTQLSHIDKTTTERLETIEKAMKIKPKIKEFT